MHPVSGVVIPAVTPIGEGGRPDFGAGRRHFDALAAAGITKLMLLGTNGEGPPLRPLMTPKPMPCNNCWASSNWSSSHE